MEREEQGNARNETTNNGAKYDGRGNRPNRARKQDGKQGGIVAKPMSPTAGSSDVMENDDDDMESDECEGEILEQTVVSTPISSDAERKVRRSTNDTAARLRASQEHAFAQGFSGTPRKDEVSQEEPSRIDAKQSPDVYDGRSTRPHGRGEDSDAPFTAEDLGCLNLAFDSSSRRGSTIFFWKRADLEDGVAQNLAEPGNDEEKNDGEAAARRRSAHAHAPTPLSARKLLSTGQAYAVGQRRRFIRFLRPGAVHMNGRAPHGVNPALRLMRRPTSTGEQERLPEIEAAAVVARQGQPMDHNSSAETVPNSIGGVGVSAFLVGESRYFNTNENNQTVIEGVHVEKIAEQQSELDSVSLSNTFSAALLCIVLVSIVAVASGTIVLGKMIGDPPPPTPTISPTLVFSSYPSLSPTSDRRVRIMDNLKSVSSTKDLQTQGTPQNRAMEWIIDSDPLQREAEDPRLFQRYILTVFFYATDGERWSCEARFDSSQCKGWTTHTITFLTEKDECEWIAVSCVTLDGLLLVDGLFLRGAKELIMFGGTLPSELGRLPMLQKLILPYHEIRGAIPPEIISLRLQILSLTSNRLSGPFPEAAFLDHRSLQAIQVGRNNFGGTVPASIGTIKTLRMALFPSCGMSGRIPTVLGQLTSLTQLDLHHNMLTGSLPSDLGKSRALEKLLLSQNRLSGTIPETLYGAWPKLSVLALDNNTLSGTIGDSNGTITWGRNNSQRKLILLSNNSFQGTVPRSLASINRLYKLELHGNKFVGTMPREICARTERGEEGGIFFVLKNLTADCLENVASKDAAVHCDCCSRCY